MQAVLGNEIKNDNGQKQFPSGVPIDPMQYPPLRFCVPGKHPHGENTKGCVDCHGGPKKNQIRSRMAPRSVTARKKGTDALEDQMKRHAPDDPKQLLPRWH
jgi:hypothetical protein